MNYGDNTDIKLTIGDSTIAAKGRIWEQTPGHGVARIGDELVRFTYVEGESQPYLLEGVIHPEDIAKLPSGFFAHLSRRCTCGNAIGEEEDWCDYCLEHAPEQDEDFYHEPTSVIIQEQAQREYDQVWNEEG